MNWHLGVVPPRSATKQGCDPGNPHFEICISKTKKLSFAIKI